MLQKSRILLRTINLSHSLFKPRNFLRQGLTQNHIAWFSNSNWKPGDDPDMSDQDKNEENPMLEFWKLKSEETTPFLPEA
jgi:hypothetical protein